MIFILSLFVFIQSIYAFNCSVSQVHIAQGLNPNSMTISWLTIDDCFSHVKYGINNISLSNTVYGSSSSYEFLNNKNLILSKQ